jgi:hypothetical protein
LSLCGFYQCKPFIHLIPLTTHTYNLQYISSDFLSITQKKIFLSIWHKVLNPSTVVTWATLHFLWVPKNVLSRKQWPIKDSFMILVS